MGPADRRTSDRRFLEQLNAHPLFLGLEPDEVDQVVDRFSIHRVPASQIFLEQGAPSDALFVLLVGRCRVVIDGAERVRVGRGAVFGEVGVLSGEPRSADVATIRECVVARLSLHDLEEITRTVPLFWRSLGMAAGRLAAGRRLGAESGTGARLVAVVPMDGSRGEGVFDPLLEALVEERRVVRFRSEDVLDPETLDRAERENDVVLLETSRRDPSFSWRLRQADHIVLVADACERPRAAPLPEHTASTHLFLLQPPGTRVAQGTRGWLEATKPRDHHHIRRGHREDASRAARLLLGRGTGLSLAGGAARAIAHLGLVRAVKERGIEVDAYTGSSAGGALAAFLALGWTEEAAVEGFNALLSCMTPALHRLTLPIAGIMTGGAPVQYLREALGDVRIEDLLTPLLIPATDLRTAELHVFRSGPLWRAVRATGSLPFFWPPLVWEGRVLADAGLVCNQPVELLADSCGEGWLIASDLGGSGTAALEGLPDADSMSGWRAAVQRWQGINVPQLTTTLIRSMTLGDGDARARLDRLGRPFRTTWMQLPVDDVGFFGGESRQSAVIDRAQAHAQEVFDREIGPSST